MLSAATVSVAVWLSADMAQGTDGDARPNRHRSMSIEVERDALRRGSLEITMERSRTLNTEKFYNGALVCGWLLQFPKLVYSLL